MRDPLYLARLIAGPAGRGRSLSTRDIRVPLDAFDTYSPFGSARAGFEGRSVVVHTRDMAKAAAALIDLDGWARRLVLCPPGWDANAVRGAIQACEADALVHDGDDAPLDAALYSAACRWPLAPLDAPRVARHITEWALPTSGTSGPPKWVAHDLGTLMGAIGPTPLQQWATFYDIRRYGGLQIFLRALMGRGSLHLCGEGESVDAFLARLGAVGITHISGTPSHWRKVLMSAEARRIAPETVRLSGEIADDAVLRGLRELYPRAKVEHAYASTEAGVVFCVEDGRAGFPASFLERAGTVDLKIVEGALLVRSSRVAHRFLGSSAPPLQDADGFVDTGDMVELRGDRYVFVGRRGGIINVGGSKVHPEEVEAALNAHQAVRASRVFARKNPITGAIVVAEIVLADAIDQREGLEREIIASCRARLPAHMTPARLRFVADLPMTDGGKLARHG